MTDIVSERKPFEIIYVIIKSVSIFMVYGHFCVNKVFMPSRANYLDAVDTLEPLPDAFFNPLYEKLKMYYVTGGMPESVLMWTQARDVEAMQETSGRCRWRNAWQSSGL